MVEQEERGEVIHQPRLTSTRRTEKKDVPCPRREFHERRNLLVRWNNNTTSWPLLSVRQTVVEEPHHLLRVKPVEFGKGAEL